MTLIKTPRSTKKGQAIFTAADVFNNFEEAAIHSRLVVLKPCERDILSLLAKQKHIRNQKQLDYLASVKQSADHVIRFSLKPLFGFIFCVSGQDMNHFCWELLNSNATYIWSTNNVQSSMTAQFNRLTRRFVKSEKSDARDIGTPMQQVNLIPIWVSVL